MRRLSITTAIVPPPARVPQLVLLIGIQASGKTAFYRERFFASHVRISRDLLRTPAREAAFLALCISTGMDAVIDNTNPSRADRARFIAPARAAGFAVSGYCFATDLPGALARNAAREGAARIPDAGLRNCAARLAAPTRDEGFDALYQAILLPQGGFLITEWHDGIL